MEGGPSTETHRDLGSSQFSEESKPAYRGHMDTVCPQSVDTWTQSVLPPEPSDLEKPGVVIES